MIQMNDFNSNMQFIYVEDKYILSINGLKPRKVTIIYPDKYVYIGEYGNINYKYENEKTSLVFNENVVAIVHTLNDESDIKVLYDAKAREFITDEAERILFYDLEFGTKNLKRVL